MARTATIERETNETTIRLQLNLDGTGTATIKTGVGFLDHMLELLAKHGVLDLEVQATGDLHVDQTTRSKTLGFVSGRLFVKRLEISLEFVGMGISPCRWKKHWSRLRSI